MRRTVPLIILAASVTGTMAWADESAFQLKSAPGRDLVASQCVMCHSLDYLQMNSPFLDRKGWEATVNKMIKAMGAPVPPGDVPAILDYLASQYGK